MNRVWINKAKRRYYRAHLQPDLFGDWTQRSSHIMICSVSGDNHLDKICGSFCHHF
jgi:hypothetical protein